MNIVGFVKVNLSLEFFEKKVIGEEFIFVSNYIDERV